MAKKIKTVIKLQIPGGGATPAPPVGPALGQHGLNIQEFVTKFNAATQDRRGETAPCEITVYEDRTFTFVLKTPPASDLIKKAAKISSGSKKAPGDKVGKITWAQAREIGQRKMPDLNTANVDAAARMIAGTARQMGVDVI
ncbi:MAG: 50S ribosomal protein L11 [Candidatus Magasanikbacteria bacterium RIFCSPHIGHO2_01_FULL_50_8]|uniref:Large ribosomal subunit protein uL11 n=2 Tax=Candidatus Magasanikiibacteriota TaxID=1752731 RepID=A0A1F6LVV7_9BACT|nr:MAG: 50S ribosomal protein L11 [Candidatus Magasanikbacteria bacterium RIFCSPHIGHO2_01_FULL_50_8]OGH67754.1 MAG: 50S ribosomal protein L11 [Candidatus Magasanikbacteria bacterium RIFCSPHIGHO2_02_FULL_50_9b]